VLPLVLVGVFVGTLLVVVAAYTVVNRRRLVAADTLRERLAPIGPVTTGRESILKHGRTSQLEFLNRLLEGKSFATRLAGEIRSAGMRLSVGEYVLLTAVGGGAGLLAGQYVDPLLGVPGVAIGVLAPYLVLKRRQRVRLRKFEAALPDAIDMLVNAMKAGYSFQAAMKFIGDEMPAPLGVEFARVYDEQRLGLEVRDALLNLQSRISTLNTKMFVTALLLQRETGGNLAEIMSNLSTLMRERVMLSGQIDTLTAEPRLSALVLALMPPVLFLLISSLNRNYLETLWLTHVGRTMIAYGMLSTVVGYLLLRRLGNIDV
jgi:tight adherence protein B